MRFDGKLDKWNDDRGFGFIAPLHGGEPVFVHVSAFARDGRRPKVGEALTFEVEPAGDGKKRAVNVQRSGAGPSRPTGPRAARTSGATRGKAFSLGRLIPALIVVALGAYAYTQYTGRVQRLETPLSSQGGSSSGAKPFRCDGRTHCSQMTSCEEAKFFLRSCSGTRMDGDNDGVPCEAQWCGGR